MIKSSMSSIVVCFFLCAKYKYTYLFYSYTLYNIHYTGCILKLHVHSQCLGTILPAYPLCMQFYFSSAVKIDFRPVDADFDVWGGWVEVEVKKKKKKDIALTKFI